MQNILQLISVNQIDESIQRQRAQKNAPNSGADNAIMHRSLEYVRQQKEFLAYCSLMRETSFPAIMCALSGSPSVVVKVTATWEHKWQNLSPCPTDDWLTLLVPITDHLIAD